MAKKKTLATILLSSVIGLFVLWFVLLAIRYSVFQKSSNIGANIYGIIKSFGDLEFFLPLNDLIWKGIAWLVLLAALIFIIAMIVDTVKTRKRGLGIVSAITIVLALLPVLDFISNSGNYFYYFNRFTGANKNVFAVVALIGFLALGALIVALTVLSYLAVSKIDAEALEKEFEDSKEITKTEQDGREIILSVKHLKQFFKFGRGIYKYTKAVHDVSFDVYKGEVFGLVGESGCGKTTTGRSIIKLYKITSGDVWFKGVRIAAGTRWNEKEIKFTRIRLNKFLKDPAIKKQEKDEIAAVANSDNKSAEIKAIKAKYAKLRQDKINEAKEIINTQRVKIARAKHDDKYCNQDIIKEEVSRVNEKYADVIAQYNEIKADIKKPENKEFLEKYNEYKAELFEAKHASITRKMQMIFQDPIASLNPRMTVGNIIAEGLVIKGVKDKAFIKSEVNRVLELVGLVPEHANRYPHEFSGGQRQRIGIARAIIMNPELIIADEPVSALDVSIQAQVINLLNDLRNKLGLTILFVAHNLSVVKYFCDRIAVMYYGELMEVATSEELFAHPLHPYTVSLLSAVPHPDPNVERGRERVTYVPSRDHDYSEQRPTLREIVPGHFVRCNDKEAEAYLKVLKGE